MRKELVFLLTFAAGVLCGCSSDDDTGSKNDRKDIELSVEESAIVSVQNSRAFDMLKFYDENTEDKNFIISPLSAQFALGMLANGAHGNTLNELTAALGVESLGELNSLNKRLLRELPKADKKVKFRAANSVWLDNRFEVLPSYSRAVGEWYDAEATSLDLSDVSSIRRINSWCDQKTEGMIPKVLDILNPDAMFYLINSLYFKGEWNENFKFDKANTKDKDFTNIAGIIKKVPMMCNKLTCRYYDGEKYGILKMDFGNGSYSMYIILPDEDFSLGETISLFDGDVWTMTKDNRYIGECNIELPRFKIDSYIDHIPYLKYIGVKDVFYKNDADLSALSQQKIYVSDAFQVSGIEVDENGAEAASVTVIGSVEYDHIPSKKIDFIMNRPFAFVIEETSTKTILFMGCVKDL